MLVGGGGAALKGGARPLLALAPTFINYASTVSGQDCMRGIGCRWGRFGILGLNTFCSP